MKILYCNKNRTKKQFSKQTITQLSLVTRTDVKEKHL